MRSAAANFWLGAESTLLDFRELVSAFRLHSVIIWPGVSEQQQRLVERAGGAGPLMDHGARGYISDLQIGAGGGTRGRRIMENESDLTLDKLSKAGRPAGRSGDRPRATCTAAGSE